MAGVYFAVTKLADADAMSPFGPAALLLLVALLPVDAAAMEPASACLDAAAMAERDWMLPQDLVAAIGRTESGRLDHLTGRVSPWPWTVNANGSGSYFATRAEAVGFVRNLQASGVRLIDVGCFQVDLFYHPAAFASLEEAFDPGANANYAARFLTALHAQTGDWSSAVARYHSGLALEGESYRLKVMSQWRADAALIDGRTPSAARAGSLHRQAVARAPEPDRYVVLMSADARAIHIFGPSFQYK